MQRLANGSACPRARKSCSFDRARSCLSSPPVACASESAGGGASGEPPLGSAAWMDEDAAVTDSPVDPGELPATGASSAAFVVACATAKVTAGSMVKVGTAAGIGTQVGSPPLRVVTTRGRAVARGAFAEPRAGPAWRGGRKARAGLEAHTARETPTCGPLET
eukprot:scaffold11434_cov127-Isochrysis_galbana.AAC.7